VPTVELVGPRPRGAGSAEAREQVVRARARQRERLRGTAALCNGEMDARVTRRVVPPERRLASRLLGVADPALLSGRGQDRVLRVARTIADLAGRPRVGVEHLEEALAYRVPYAMRAAA
jgi:magnesium chelatase family protein